MATLGSLAVGSSVYMNIDGVRTEFLVVHQGLPSTEYDASCNGTWVLMKNIYTLKTAGEQLYASSNNHDYLSGEFMTLLDADIYDVVLQAKIPYSTSRSQVVTGANGLSVKAFLPSYTELGGSSSGVSIEGATLSYFQGADNKARYAYYNGKITKWWTRSPRTTAMTVVCANSASTGMAYQSVTSENGVRPAMILDSLGSTDANGNIIAAGTSLGGFAKINGEYKELSGGYAKVNGEWREITGSYKNMGGWTE